MLKHVETTIQMGIHLEHLETYGSMSSLLGIIIFGHLAVAIVYQGANRSVFCQSSLKAMLERSLQATVCYDLSIIVNPEQAKVIKLSWIVGLR